MKKTLISTSALVSFASTVPVLADVDPLPQLPPVVAYETPAAGGEFIICTGGVKGAYFRVGGQIAGIIEAAALDPELEITVADASPLPGGGTAGCLDKLAKGEVDAAIIQSDGRALLKQIGPDLASTIDMAGPVLTEEVITICSRKVEEEDFGDVAQRSGSVIAVGGGEQSGTNIMLNVIASLDGGYKRPDYVYKKSLTEAVKEVADGDADCAVAVMDINAQEVADISRDYGDQVRLIGAWDSNFRSLEFRDEQVYGWRAIPEDTAGIKELLDWNGKGKLWSPEVVTETAIVVYREDLSDNYAELLKKAVAQVAKLKTDVQD